MKTFSTAFALTALLGSVGLAGCQTTGEEDYYYSSSTVIERPYYEGDVGYRVRQPGRYAEANRPRWRDDGPPPRRYEQPRVERPRRDAPPPRAQMGPPRQEQPWRAAPPPRSQPGADKPWRNSPPSNPSDPVIYPAPRFH